MQGLSSVRKRPVQQFAPQPVRQQAVASLHADLDERGLHARDGAEAAGGDAPNAGRSPHDLQRRPKGVALPGVRGGEETVSGLLLHHQEAVGQALRGEGQQAPDQGRRDAVGDVGDHLRGEGHEGGEVRPQRVTPVKAQAPLRRRGQRLKLRPQALVQLDGVQQTAPLQEGARQDALPRPDLQDDVALPHP